MSKLTFETTRRVLTLSVHYVPPKGGIAQVIEAYSSMYPVFNHVSTVRGDSSIEKLMSLLLALIKFSYICLFRGVRIVHVHGASNNSFWRKRIFIFLAKLFRKKVIYHIHGGQFKGFYKSNLGPVRSAFNRVDTVVAISESWRLFFERDIGHQDVRVIENVVSTPEFHSVGKDGLVHFLFLGQIGENKGIYDLLDALFEGINSIRGRAVLHVGGNGEVDKLARRVKELGLEEVVVFEGWVSGHKKNQLLNLADVYILPSYSEGLPLSILEAMSYGLPVISTPVGGIPEIVTHRENGLLIDPGDKAAIRDAVIEMVNNESFRTAAGEASLINVQPYFSGNVAGKLEAMYQDLLDGAVK